MNDDTQNPVTSQSQTPLDPSNDMTNITDTDERTGMTVNNASSAPLQEDTPPTQNTMSSAMQNRAFDAGSEPTSTGTSSAIPSPAMAQPSSSSAQTIIPPSVIPGVAPQSGDSMQASSSASVSPSIQGEQSVSGDMPSPEADDDTLLNAQAMGFQVDEDSENPKPLNMAADFDKGEEEAHK